MVKRSNGINVHNLIQQIENHPQREALHNIVRSIPSAKSQKMQLWLAGNTELCEIINVEPKSVQSMPHALERRNCVLHMWTPYER